MNKMPATIVTCESNGHLWRVVTRVGDTQITAVLLEFAKSGALPVAGEAVWVLFKESETALALDLPPHSLSIRNRLPCRVVSVDDDGLLANVNLECAGHPLRSLITSESAHDLSIRPGAAVHALIKATEVMVDLEDA